MFEIEIDRTFSAAHQLRGYNGDCSNLHGHNYKVTVTVQSSTVDEIGIALDFKKLKSQLDELLSKFDHRNLSELEEFKSVNPTSEMLAKRIFDDLNIQIKDNDLKLVRVRIGESDHSAVTYFE